MLQLFRNNSPFTVIILFIMALLLKLHALLQPMLPPFVHGLLAYNYVLRVLAYVFGKNPFGYAMLAIIMLFAQAMYLNKIATSHKLFARGSYLPAFAYIALTSVYPPFSYFSEPLLLNWLLLGAMDIMLSFNQSPNPRKHIFNAAFILSVAGIFQFSAVGFLLLFFMSMAVLRSFNAGEWIVGLMGYFTPLYFFAGILFLTDKMPYIKYWPAISFLFPVHVVSPFYIITVLSCIFILFAGGLFALQQNVPKSTIYIRRSWVAVTFYFITSAVVVLCTGPAIANGLLLLVPSLSLLITQGLSLEKSKRFSNFIFYFLLVFVIFCQFAYK